MADVFISYCSADRARVGEIALALEKEGLGVWWDRALIPGERYEAEIDRALAAAKTTIVIWSPASAASDWVRSEAESARVNGTLVPATIEPCTIPRPFDRLHTADLSNWRGDRGNHGFPELLEAVKSVVEGRAAKPVPWRRRLTLAAIGSALVAGVIFLSALTGIVDAAIRWSSAGSFAERGAQSLSPDGASAETQAGFRDALSQLARSTDLRTQRALSQLEHGSRDDALSALYTLAGDQGGAIEGQMRRSADLWRQIGLLRFNDDPRAAMAAFENASRYAPDDASILTPLGALYQRAGRISDADRVYRTVLMQGVLDASTEGRLRQVIGQAHLERSENEAAELEFNRAMTLAQEAVDDMLEADLNIDLGLVTMSRGDFVAARAQFEQAKTFAQSFDYAPAVAYADFNTAQAYLEEGQLDRAETMLRETKQYATSQHDQYLGLFADLALARIALMRGEGERASGIAANVHDEANTTGVRRVELEALMQIAEADLMLGRYPQAQQNARTASAGWRQLRADDSVAIATILTSVADSYDAAKRDEACAVLRARPRYTGYANREITRLQRLSRC